MAFVAENIYYLLNWTRKFCDLESSGVRAKKSLANFVRGNAPNCATRSNSRGTESVFVECISDSYYLGHSVSLTRQATFFLDWIIFFFREIIFKFDIWFVKDEVKIKM